MCYRTARRKITKQGTAFHFIQHATLVLLGDLGPGKQQQCSSASCNIVISQPWLAALQAQLASYGCLA